MKKLFALLLALVFAVNAFSFSVKAPEKVFVKDGSTFFIELSNDSPFEKSISLDFFAPVQSKMKGLPKTIGGKETAIIEVALANNKQLLGDNYEATLVVKADNETIEKKILLSFEEKPSIESTALFSLALPEMNISELALNAFLLIVAAVLLIAFVSRLTKRLALRLG